MKNYEKKLAKVGENQVIFIIYSFVSYYLRGEYLMSLIKLN